MGCVGGVGELFQFAQPTGRDVGVTGSDGRIQPVVRSEPGQRWLGHLFEVVQRRRGLAVQGGMAALRPPPAVLHQHTKDSGRRPSGDPIQFGEQSVVARIAAQGGQQRKLGQRHGGQGGLPGAAGQLHRLGGMCRCAGPVPTGEVGERQSGQREQHKSDRAVIAGLCQHATEAPAEAIIIAEVEGGDPEIGQQVRLGQRLAEGDGLPQRNDRGGKSVVVELVEPGQQVGETPCPG